MAVSMPVKDEAAVKEYLLHAHCRSALLKALGATAPTVPGADALEPLLRGRCFVCLHYKLGPGAALQPCLPEGGAPSSNIPEPDW